MALSLEITPNASKALMKLHQNPLAHYIRISAGSSCGCGKVGFKMQWDDRKNFGDTVIKTTSTNLVIDRTTKVQLQGGTIDYSDDPINKGFRITAPESSSHPGGCGCGGAH